MRLTAMNERFAIRQLLFRIIFLIFLDYFIQPITCKHSRFKSVTLKMKVKFKEVKSVPFICKC